MKSAQKVVIFSCSTSNLNAFNFDFCQEVAMCDHFSWNSHVQVFDAF